MSLNALLKEHGISKSTLADILGVSRQTVHRYGDDVTDEIQAAILAYKPVVKAKKRPQDYTSDEIREICKRRGGLEADVNREKETDYEIACSLGIKVFDLHEMIDRFTGKVRKQLRRPENVSDAYIRENAK
jgi:predicted transcriptional regulator